jgi:hypothetical protein
MARALEDRSTDLIGLARPLTSEPFLCRDLIAGKSAGAKPNLVAEAIQTGASILQLPAIARGHPEVTAQLTGKASTDEGDLKAQKDSSSYGQSKA